MLSGDNGILKQAVDAKEKTEQSQEKEQRTLAAMEAATNLENTTIEYTNKNGEEKTVTKIPTGSSEHNKANNIYDIAGNLWEWTQEDSYTYGRVYRGCRFTRALAQRNKVRGILKCYNFVTKK